MARREKFKKDHKPSSTRWLQRQMADTYVDQAKAKGYRARSAFKIIQLDDKYKFFRPGLTVLDLGAAPGGWSQIAAERVKAKEGKGKVIGIDLLEVEPIMGAVFLKADMRDPSTDEWIASQISKPVDIVLCDMAPNTTGDSATDHYRIISLGEVALEVVKKFLRPGGVLVLKLRQGADEQTFMKNLRGLFTKVNRAKPPASRQESAEFYVVASGFKGNGSTGSP
ncbi:MAG: RlmE family RNA methyltransferase [Dongiaceae bacterium]